MAMGFQTDEIRRAITVGKSDWECASSIGTEEYRLVTRQLADRERIPLPIAALHAAQFTLDLGQAQVRRPFPRNEINCHPRSMPATRTDRRQPMPRAQARDLPLAIMFSFCSIRSV
jgi:hypothetical protein